MNEESMNEEGNVTRTEGGWGFTLFTTLSHWFPGDSRRSLCGLVRGFEGYVDPRRLDGDPPPCPTCERLREREQHTRGDRYRIEVPTGLPERVLERWRWHEAHSDDPRRATVAEFRAAGLTRDLLTTLRFREELADTALPVLYRRRPVQIAEVEGIARLRVLKEGNGPETERQETEKEAPVLPGVVSRVVRGGVASR